MMRLVTLGMAGLLAATGGCHRPQGIGKAVYVEGRMVTGYRPAALLATASHQHSTGKYPSIDVHSHFELDRNPAQMIEAMDQHGVRAVVNLSGGWGEHLDQFLEKFHQYAPDRFYIFCNLDFSRIDEPHFGRKMADFLEAARAKGVSGLKIFKRLGLYARDKTGRLIAVDDTRLDPVWAKAGALGMPVLIHTADPAAFFQPVDRLNERWMQLARHPDWSFHGKQFPSRQTLLEQRNRVMARHRSTIFIGAHVASSSEDLRTVGRWLDKFPNFYVDISGRVGELGRQPYTARKFFIQYQDRILFGTDRYPGRADQPRYRIYYRFLETADEYFDYYDHPFAPAGDWKIYGVYLPDDVLRKIYYGNAERVLLAR